MPALHEPHASTTNAEDFAVDIGCVVTGEPSNEWGNVVRAKEVVFPFFWFAHQACRLGSSIDGHTCSSKGGNGIGSDAVLLQFAVNNDRQRRDSSFRWT